MRNHIPTPNPFLTQLFLSPEWVSVGWQASQLLADMYSVVVAKDSGALAASPVIESSLGGEKFDRIVFDVISDRGLPRGGYGASHEFGVGGHPESQSWEVVQRAADDWVKVLAIVDSLP